MAASLCWAQGSGTIQGVITDSSGAVIEGATVRIENKATGVMKTSVTNQDGRYVVPFLSPGHYAITVERAGFTTATRADVLLQVDQVLPVGFELQLGATTTRVEVTTAPPLVNPDQAALGQVIDNKRIVELPLDGREPISLAGLAPGVNPVAPGANIHQGGAIPSINGASNFTSEVLIDGMSDVSPRNSGLGSFLIYTPTVDAVSEFRVETNALSAEYGRFNGGVISVVMKSGTNTLHGSVYEFLRNSALDANNFFNNRNGIPLGPLKRNQFGFTLGGPVVIPRVYNGRNKTFFFVDYEGFRQRQLSSVSYTVPTAAQRSGDFSQTFTPSGQLVTIYDPTTLHTENGKQVRTAFPENKVPLNQINSVAKNLLGYYPLPMNKNLTGNYVVSPPVQNTDDTGDARLDHNFGDRNRLFGRFSIQYPFTGSPNSFGNIATPDNPPLTQRRYSGTLQDTFTISPTLILNLGYGITRMYGTRTAWSDGLDITTLGFAPNFAAGQQVKAMPVITLTGYTGLGNANQNYSTQLVHSLTGSLTKVWGSHTVKTGAEFRTFFINQLQNTQAEGALSFANTYTQGPNPFQASATAGNAFAAFLLGIPSGSIAIQPAVASKSWYSAVFIQDDWKLTRKLTLNLGLRYDYSSPRTERYNRMSIFDPDATSPIAGQVPGFPNLKGALDYVGPDHRSYAPADANNVGPRLGLAYLLRPNTTIRSGYGIFYGLSPTDASGPSGGFVDGFTGSTSIVTSLDGATPIVSLEDPFPNGINPAASRSQLSASTNLGQSLRSVNGGQATPYFQNWNFSLQQGFGSDVVITAAYAGNKGTRLPFAGAININSLTRQQYELGAVNNQLVSNPFYGVITDPTSPLSKTTVARGQLLKPYPQYQDLFEIFATRGNSIYHSLQLSVEKRFSRGFTLLGAFTASKVIDDSSQAGSGQLFPTIQDPTDLRAERSIDPQDVSQRLVISGVWELPFGRGRHFGRNLSRWADLAIGGWQLNGVSTFAKGQPLIMTSIGAGRPNVVGTPKQYSGAIQDRLAHYFDTSAYAVPAAFTYGNSSPTAPNLRSAGIANYDLSLFKSFSITERMRAQLRFESFNAFNRVQFAAPGTQAGTANFGVITAQSNNPRELQVALKILF
jgi:hypothetical protein